MNRHVDEQTFGGADNFDDLERSSIFTEASSPTDRVSGLADASKARAEISGWTSRTTCLTPAHNVKAARFHKLLE